MFEIHGGGIDLVFPHHENELAQSRALGHEFARIWTHNGMLEFTSEKMSKSLGNDVSLRNVLDTWGREVVLLFYMTGHWRKPIDFSDETLEQARAQTETFRDAFRSPAAGTDGSGAAEPREALDAALDDDFDTPRALAVLHSWRRAGRLDWLREGPAIFGLESLAEAEEPPEDVAALAEPNASARGPNAASTRQTGCGARSRQPAGRCATWRTASSSSLGGDAGADLRPARGSGGPPRPPRGARALGD